MAQIYKQEKDENNPVAQQKEKDEAAKDMEVYSAYFRNSGKKWSLKFHVFSSRSGFKAKFGLKSVLRCIYIALSYYFFTQN